MTTTRHQNWLTMTSETECVVDADVYIASQPVHYSQVRDVIESIRERGKPIRARIDISRVRLARVNIIGVVRIIWEIHKHTYGEPLLELIVFTGAKVPPNILYLLPEFIAELVRFE